MSQPAFAVKPDLPELATEDLWPGVYSLAKRISARIDGFHATSPVLISGDWGQGKTTLLRAIERCVHEGSGQGQPPRTLFFEAWRHEASGLLLPALLRAIFKLLPEGTGEASLGSKIWHWAVVASVGMAGSLAGIAGGAAAPLTQALLGLREDEQEGGAPKKLKIPEEDVTSQLQSCFRELLSPWRSGPPLVIFIDDLDRCSPAGAVALLDALRQLLHQTSAPAGEKEENLPCRFVVALDRKVLADAVAKKFAEISSYEGNRYLEKIFPLTFDLPRPETTEVRPLLLKLLQPASPPSGSENRRRDSPLAPDQLDALEAALGDPLFANPRLMKRCIQRFTLLLAFEAEAPDRFSGADRTIDDTLTVLARWIAATERWPALRDLLARQGEAALEAVSQGLSAAETKSLDPDFRRLLEEYGAWAWLTHVLAGPRQIRVDQLRSADRRLRTWGL